MISSPVKIHLESQFKLATGFVLSMNILSSERDYVEDFELSSTLSSFWLCLSGNEENSFLNKKKRAVLSQDSVGIFMGGKGLKGKTSIAARTPVQIISIRVDPVLLRTVLGNQYETLPKLCRRVAQGDEDGYFFYSMPMPPMIRGALEQILNCPFGEENKKLYYEGKALEIMACLLENIKFGQAPKSSLSSTDIERIHYARKLLVHDVVNPPGLMALARSVGLHHSKLNRGFRAVFGSTVFGYLRETRLNRAMELLCKKNMNCAEVSFSVGYNNLSHFAKAFKEQFGTNPSSLL